jgi:hypothetical protein
MEDRIRGVSVQYGTDHLNNTVYMRMGVFTN